VTYSGPYSSSTPNKYFVYDAATVNGVAMTNVKTRMAEAYTATSPSGTKITDIGLSYSARGENSDVYESTPNSGNYYHTSATSWANGVLDTLAAQYGAASITGWPTFTYGPDGEGRINTVSASVGQNPVTGTTYSVASLATQVSLGSSDTDSFTYDPDTNRMTKYTFAVNSESVVGNLTWNPIGTLETLVITDPFYAAGNQTCSYAHDDLSRVATANCGTIWGQSFTYDAFGNITKTVLCGSNGIAFQPLYSYATNHMTQVGGSTPTYDANGNATNDTAHTYAWDAAGRPVNADGVTLTYDALGRMVEQNKSGTHYQIVYAPTGGKFAIMNGSTLQMAFVPLTGGLKAVYNATSLVLPTERLRFQSNYFKNFEMSGSFGYSTSDNVIPDFLETVNGFTARTGERVSTTGGPANAKRVSVNANWSGVYSIGDKLRILDEFRYDDWRIPGMWALDETNIFGTGYPGLAGLQQSEAVFNVASCSAPFTAVTCPQHAPATATSAGSAADVTASLASTFLGQNLKSNTLELEYDLNRRVSAHMGYLYTNRTIAQFVQDGPTDTKLVYFPTNAARGNCAAGAATAVDCTLNPDGSMTYIAPAAASPTRLLTTINENALLLGAVVRPIDALRITGDLEFGYNDNSYTRIDPRQVQSYKIHANYKPRPWATIDGAVEIHENRDNVSTVDNLEHDRSYSFATILTANPRLSVDFGYNYWNVFTQSIICFAYSTSYTNPAPPPATLPVSTFPPGVSMLPTGPACPITGASSPLGALSTYSSTDHFAHAAVMWRPMKRVTVMVGYGGSFVRGNTIFLNPLTPSGTLDFNYQRPYASIAIDVYRNLSYKMSWNYYGFNETGNTNPFGLAAIQLQDFNGSNATFSFRYAF